MPVDQLVPAPYNPRQVLRPGSPAHRKLAASLREFGLVEPLIWNRQTGHVVGGHARLGILKSLGVTDVSVAIVDLPPAREKALNVVLNNQEAQGRYDLDKLRSVLEELSDLPEQALTGFDANHLASLNYAPASAPIEPPTPTGQVTITLEMTAEQYAQAEGPLNQLIGDLGLVSHFRSR